ncbi:MAG: hypothetical protein COA69_09015 [Robiginitomaculum sp.]|nr:MAG: hypothetical protein COA69_09015 [Robiginitomaculum sp.]
MIESITRSFETSATPLPEGVSPKWAAIIFSRWYFGLLPLVTALFLLFLPVVFRAWQRETSYVLRQRYVFVTVLPSTAIGLLMAMLTRYISADQITTFTTFSLLIYTAVNFITAFRGGFSEARLGGRLWRALLLSFCLFVIIVVAAIMTQIFAVVSMALYYS